jgi:hypothetical protein
MPNRRSRQHVVVPYVRTMLRPETHRAVLQQRRRAEFVELAKTSPTAYARLLIERLTPDRTVVIVEQDIVPPARAIDNLQGCRHAWCTVAYRHGGELKTDMLGLAKFGSWLHTLHPRWIEAALLGGVGGHMWPHWRSCDTLIARWLRVQGIEPHVHRGEAVHLHDAPTDLSTWMGWPLLTPVELNPHAPDPGQTETPPEVSSDGVPSDVGCSVGGANRGDRAQDDRRDDQGGEGAADDRQRPEDDPHRQRAGGL